MDILAAMLAYLVSVAAIVGALSISLFVFFATPGQQQWLLQHAKARVVTPGAIKTASANVREPTQNEQIGETVTAGAAQAQAQAQAQAGPVRTIAVEMRQKSTKSLVSSRRLAAKERAKRLAYREESFENRFLRNEN